MEQFNAGDRVRIKNMASSYFNTTGVVKSVALDAYGKAMALIIALDGEDARPEGRGFFLYEAEKIKPTVRVEVDLNAEDGYTVPLDLTPAELEGVRKLVAGAKEQSEHYPYSPSVTLRVLDS